MSSFVAGATGLLFVVVLVPLFVRLASRMPAIVPLTVTLIAAHVGSTILGASLLECFNYWHAASAFGFLACIYVYAFGAVYKSVSLSTLLALASRSDGAAPLSVVVGTDATQRFEERIDLLVESGWAKRSGDAYVVAPAGRAWATSTNMARRLFGVTDAALYDSRKSE